MLVTKNKTRAICSYLKEKTVYESFSVIKTFKKNFLLQTSARRLFQRIR